MKRIHPAALVALVVAGCAMMPAPPAVAGNSRYRVRRPLTTLARINAIRASFGAPALRLVPEWSSGCEAHMNYVRFNALSHDEQRGRHGYTAAGAETGVSSVLFWPAKEPFTAREPLGAWYDAPYHQFQVLNPLLRSTGFSQGCMDTHRGVISADDPSTGELEPGQPAAPPPPRLFVWPGQNSHSIPRTINACNERPGNPFTDVGWSCGGVGTALYIYALDANVDRCFYTDTAPQMTLSAWGHEIPLQITEDSCGWILVTGRALPAKSPIELTVSLAGSTVSREFWSRKKR